ncbi:MAG: hypothetical protein ABIT01_19570 [Thermoanaerobaculia bacterium]
MATVAKPNRRKRANPKATKKAVTKAAKPFSLTVLPMKPGEVPVTTANRRELSLWAKILEGVVDVAGKAFIPIPGIWGDFLTTALDGGIESLDLALSGDPVTEHWTADMVAAQVATIVDPKT